LLAECQPGSSEIRRVSGDSHLSAGGGNPLRCGADSEGRLLHEFGDHVSRCTPKQNLNSTPEEVQVPVKSGDELWGTIELRYSPINANGVIAFVNDLFPSFIVLSASFVFLLTFLYLARIFRRMYSTSQGEITERVRATLDTLVEGVLVLDKNKKIALANQSFAKSIGSTTKDLEGRKAEDLSWIKTESEGENKDLPWSTAMKENGHQLGKMLSVNSEDGQKKSFSVNSTSILDDTGNCLGALATFDDMTQVEVRNVQLKQLLQKLDESRQEVRKQNEELKIWPRRTP
jgi:PAS domain S-box-containing protein